MFLINIMILGPLFLLTWFGLIGVGIFVLVQIPWTSSPSLKLATMFVTVWEGSAYLLVALKNPGIVTALENSDELLGAGDSSTLSRRLGSLVDDLLDADLGDDVLSVVNSTVDLLNRAGVLLNLRNRGGDGRDGESENGEESGLHFECG